MRCELSFHGAHPSGGLRGDMLWVPECSHLRVGTLRCMPSPTDAGAHQVLDQRLNVHMGGVAPDACARAAEWMAVYGSAETWAGGSRTGPFEADVTCAPATHRDEGCSVIEGADGEVVRLVCVILPPAVQSASDFH